VEDFQKKKKTRREFAVPKKPLEHEESRAGGGGRGLGKKVGKKGTKPSKEQQPGGKEKSK